MGCNGSKPEDLPLVVRCRQRRDLVRAAANHRYALAAAHVSYFHSLKHVGDALRKFVDEELVLGSSSSSELSESSVSSPSLILPPNSKKKHPDGGHVKESLPSSHLRKHHEDADVDSHLDLSDSSSSGDDDEIDSEHHGDHHHHHPNDYPRSKGSSNEEVNSHLHDEDSGGSSYFNNYSGNFNNEFAPPYADPYAYPNSFSYPYPTSYADPWAPRNMMPQWQIPANYDNIYYMKKSAPATRTVIQEPPPQPNDGFYSSYWGNPPQGYNSNYGYFPTGSGEGNTRKEAPPPPPPPEPNVSAWDFFNPFDMYDNVYSGNYYSGPGYPSNTSSPDSTEVREREGIPDLEEETENEVYKEVLNGKKPRGKGNMAMPVHRSHEGSSSSSKSVYMTGEGSSRSSKPSYKSEGSSRSSKPSHKMHKGESTSKTEPSWTSEKNENPSLNPRHSDGSEKASMHYGDEESMKQPVSPVHSNGASWVDPSPDSEIPGSVHLSDDESSPESIVLKNVDEGSVTKKKKKGVTFEIGETSKHDGDSSILSSVTSLSPHGNRNLKEVVAEIRDEFETASGFGKEVAVMLEVGKLPYRPGILKAIASRVMYLVSPSSSLHDPPSTQSARLASRTSKLAKMYFDDVGNDVNAKACNLASTMDKLYAWEQKLYKEVKDEERLRYMYEKQCKRLKVLVEEGAEASKIDAVRASTRKLLTKLDVSIKAIDSVSSRIHKLRDEELEPQVAALIHGLINMWRAMLKCHRKQFQAIMESKMRKLRAKTSLQPDSNSQATAELERELRIWCDHFKEWISFQKSYAESLNNWLLQCLQYETEETPDGPIPYSPGRLGAPPIFVICNDWKQALESISGSKVASAMNSFATSLHQFLEKQDEEGRLRLRAEYLTRDYEKQVKTRHDENGGHDRDSLYVVQSDPLDDLKVDLDSMKQKVAEEKVKHKDAMKLVHEAASSSLQGGLVPIFKALESFSEQAVKAHEHVRLSRDS